MLKLSDEMEFDRVIEIRPYGEKFGVSNLRVVIDRPDIHAPSLHDEELDSPEWEFVTDGYSGQYGYSGPIMHNSELIGGKLERDILSAPGIYVALVCYWSPETDEDDDSAEGWAIARYIGADA